MCVELTDTDTSWGIRLIKTTYRYRMFFLLLFRLCVSLEKAVNKTQSVFSGEFGGYDRGLSHRCPD